MEYLRSFAALAFNVSIVILEIYVLSQLTHKKDILKYYTYLSNFIALIASAVFVVITVVNLFAGIATPIWLKGIRFSATYGLVTTLFVFNVVLLPMHKSGNLISHNDFHQSVSPRIANLMLHYLCPIISTVSLLLFERQPVLDGSEWTLYAALPTIFYWCMYLFLTVTKLWQEPYGLSGEEKESSSFGSTLLFLLIPVMSMGLDYLLWWLNTL